jgi:hypothetical protein
VGRPLVRLGLRRRLTVEGLLAAARRSSGLDPLACDDPSFVQPLTQLVQSIEEEARLSPVGRLIVRERLVSTLVNRARVDAAVRSNPAIDDTPLPAPVVILGLPRTGTTALHRMLSLDPQMRTLASWEALNPVAVRPNDQAVRIQKAKRAQKALSWMSPDFAAVHATDALAPEEEVVLLDLGFASQVAEASLQVPTYARWIESYDPLPGYRTLARSLRVLSHGDPPQQWVLKTPNHLEHVDALLTVFPDAKLVWTHRSPAECVPSLASMIAHLRGLFSDDIDAHAIGEHWLRKCGRMVDRAMAVVAKQQVPVHHMDYREFVANPISSAETLYKALGIHWSQANEEAMRKGARPQHRHGRHVYQAQDFGFTKGQIDDRFQSYRAQHSLD